MSWMKQGQSGTGPAAQPYAAPQPPNQNIGSQPNAFPNYQGVTSNAPQQQFWQMPAQQQQQQQQYGHQYGQGYSQEYPTNANQFYQQPPQFNQNYQGFNNPTPNYQPPQNYYQNRPQQTYSQPVPATDAWEDNWDWGWEDKQAQKAQNMPHAPVSHQQTFNNANVIEESFATTDSWNWSMDDKKQKESREPPAQHTKQENHEPPTLPTSIVGNNFIPGPNSVSSNVNSTPQAPAEEIRNLSDREVVKERLPNLASGKRPQLDNLTPQWSIESQMSQESSDGPHTHSEGTYRSDNQSRNSSSPGPNNIDNINYTHSGFDETYVKNNEWSNHSDEPRLAECGLSSSRRESHDELIDSIQEMNLGNHETSSKNNIQGHSNSDPRNVQESVVQPPQSVSSTVFPSAGPACVPPPLPAPSDTPPLRPPSASLPPSSSPAMYAAPPLTSTISQPQPPTTATMPSSNFPNVNNSQNPFKNAGPFSHKSSNKISSSSSGPSPQQFPAQMSSSSLASPAVVNKISSQQSRTSVAFEANLETTPDNSERPDQPNVSPYRQMPAPQPIPDNMEVAPQNDRNEYLQTAHLSSGDYGENTDFTRNLPPPGLRRLVVGQQESEYTQNLNMSGDEPPPGLARMVPGQHTETDNNVYNQPADNYMERHIDGQPTEGGARPYRQADGQHTPDNYAPPAGARGPERRPVGLDRMVPGEPSNDYTQFQSSNYANGNETRVVTGVDRDFPIHMETNPSNIREQNVDGSEYREQGLRNALSSREAVGDPSQEYGAAPDDRQREVTMEGENLQDLSLVSSADLTYSREQTVDGADLGATDGGTDRNDASDSAPAPARRPSLGRVTSTPDESDRERGYDHSPRRDKERHKAHDRDRDKEGRYSRGERKHERDDRRDRRERDPRDRRDRDDSPDARRHRRSTRSRRYDTEDTDYYSDRDKDRRSYREGSYGRRPPRDDRERSRRTHSRRYERDPERYERDPERYERDPERYERDPERYERRYRDIDPSRKHGNLRRDRDDRRRRVTFSRDAKTSDSKREDEEQSSPSRAESREAPPDDGPDARRERHRPRRHDPYYDAYGAYAGVAGGGAYVSARQYEYYSRLRRTDPAAYMELYKRVMAGHAPLYADGGALGGYPRDERDSVHSGRSSATPSKGHDTELLTDASLNLQLDESTARSERMTPFKYPTAHVKASLAAREMVVVCGGHAGEAGAGRVRLAALAAGAEDTPGPLRRGLTHKHSVVAYCAARARDDAPSDRAGHKLLWDLLALMLRQNGVVVGSDVAELLTKNTREYEYRPDGSSRNGDPIGECRAAGSRRGSAGSAEGEGAAGADGDALDTLRELVTCGDRAQALDWCMARGLWAHALALAGGADRRTRGAVAARFTRSLRAHDPLHTLYALLYNAPPPAITGAADEKWGDWRPHAAVLIANTPQQPGREIRPLTQLGDSLMSRGLLYCAQFCYLCAGVGFAAHPLAPLGGGAGGAPRLSLLFADGRAPTLAAFATSRAIVATEIYEYARSLADEEFHIPALQAYRLVLAARLADAGDFPRALAYVETAGRAAAARPGADPRLARALAALAERLAPDAAHDAPDDSGDESPRRAPWLAAVRAQAQPAPASPPHQLYEPQPPHEWDQTSQLQQPYPAMQQPAPAPTYADPDPPPDYSQYYQQPSQPPPVAAPEPPAPPADAPLEEPPAQYAYDQWAKPEEPAPAYNDYWQSDPYGYGEGAEPRPTITMPGGGRPPAALPPADQQPELDSEPAQQAPKSDSSKSKEENGKGEKGKGGGWLGGILTKLSLRPPNQMILPDDKNPTIVWDEEHKRWRNLDGDDAGGEQPPPPPPKMQDLAPLLHRSASPPLQGPNSAPTGGPPPVSNIFKMQKGRHIKKSYVDVLNPGGRAAGGAPPPPPPAPLAPPNYFVPTDAPLAQKPVVTVPPSPPPTPSPTPEPHLLQGSIYDPSAMSDGQYHSGI